MDFVIGSNFSVIDERDSLLCSRACVQDKLQMGLKILHAKSPSLSTKVNLLMSPGSNSV